MRRASTCPFALPAPRVPISDFRVSRNGTRTRPQRTRALDAPGAGDLCNAGGREAEDGGRPGGESIRALVAEVWGPVRLGCPKSQVWTFCGP